MIHKKGRKEHPIGDRIREIRGARTLDQFGALLGVRNPTVYRYETDRTPEAEMLLKIAALDPRRRGLEWLLTGEAGSLYKEAVEASGQVAEAPAEFGPRARKKRRLLAKIDELLESDDAFVLQHLERQLELLDDAVQTRRRKRQAKK